MMKGGVLSDWLFLFTPLIKAVVYSLLLFPRATELERREMVIGQKEVLPASSAATLVEKGSQERVMAELQM